MDLHWVRFSSLFGLVSVRLAGALSSIRRRQKIPCPARMVIMRAASVGKRYGRGPWIFAEVTLTLDPGQVVAISGANGSGKSTLLNVLAGSVRPTSGTISARPRHIGYVPDRFPARQRMPALAYLTHMGRIRGLSSGDSRRAASELLERFSFNAGLGAPLRTLSKGNAQKVALAQALIMPADLLILDEPWTGLDDLGRRALTEVVRESTARGGTAVVSRHLAVPDSLVYTTNFVLTDGTLTEAPLVPTPSMPASVSIATVVLRRGPGSPDLPERWAAVGTAHPDGTDVFRVPDGDGLLRAALERGWSVVSVRRPDQPG